MEAAVPAEPCRLVIVSHTLSPAQEAYQEARELRSASSSGQYFYKDATPRAEHYLCCTVELIGHPHRRPIPLKLSLCFDDGTQVPYEDQACLRLLKENVHVRPSISAETQKASFTYRIEIGSFRRADRSFVVRIDAEHPHMGSWADPAPLRIDSCITPPVYVLSKKRLATPTGVVTAPSSPASEDRMQQQQRAQLSTQSSKRKRDDGEDDEDYDFQKMLMDKMTVLERRVSELTTVVLSTVAAANVRAQHGDSASPSAAGTPMSNAETATAHSTASSSTALPPAPTLQLPPQLSATC